MKIHFVLAVCFYALIEGISVYVDHGNPYKGPGPLAVAVARVGRGEGGSPLPTVIYHPQTPGTYAPVFFVEGLDGLIPAEMYSDFLKGLASHGFMAVAPDYIWPLKSRSAFQAKSKAHLDFITDQYIAQFHWLHSNLNPWLGSKGLGVKVDWDYLAYSSHSAGADCIHKMAANLTGNPKAVVLHGPFSNTFTNPFNHSVPLLMVGTEFATHHIPIFPPCIFPGRGIDHFWTMWTRAPKIMMIIKSFGHCDLTDIAAECDAAKICISGNGTESAIFRQFAVGVTSAFLVDYMLGYSPSSRYVLDNSTMPVKVMEMKVDLN